MDKDLRTIFKNAKAVIMGVGNTLCGDDGAGPVLIEKLRGRIRALCLDAGTAPENYTGKIASEDPDVIVIVDAADLGRRPGDYAVLDKEEILRGGLTTHNMSPRMLIDYLEARTRAKIYMLGIQPAQAGFGEEISEPVRQTLEILKKTLEEVCHA